MRYEKTENITDYQDDYWIILDGFLSAQTKHYSVECHVKVSVSYPDAPITTQQRTILQQWEQREEPDLLLTIAPFTPGGPGSPISPRSPCGHKH